MSPLPMTTSSIEIDSPVASSYFHVAQFGYGRVFGEFHINQMEACPSKSMGQKFSRNWYFRQDGALVCRSLRKAERLQLFPVLSKMQSCR